MEEQLDNEQLADLVRQFVASGEHRLFRELVEQTQQAVFQVAYGITGSTADAEDVTQQTYIRACGRLDQFAFRSSVRTWLCRIAINTALDAIRRQKRRPDLRPTDSELIPLVERLESSDPSPEDRAASREIQAAVHAVLRAMKPKHRLVLTLRESEGLSYAEIAEALGCAVGTVESRLHRARRALHRKLRRLRSTEG